MTTLIGVPFFLQSNFILGKYIRRNISRFPGGAGLPGHWGPDQGGAQAHADRQQGQ